MPSGTNDPPEKTTKPLSGIVAVVHPSRQLDPATARCGLRHVARPPVLPYHTRPGRGGFLRTLTDAAPGVRVRYNNPPAYPGQYDKPITGRGPEAPR
ncbi:hypothetical protein GCM10010377_62530 [Streptomyces viridiviolaceus]|nr:hypothetical protein GCM10010377_62530 [Streptomyces viridiviolaceus]